MSNNLELVGVLMCEYGPDTIITDSFLEVVDSGGLSLVDGKRQHLFDLVSWEELTKLIGTPLRHTVAKFSFEYVGEGFNFAGGVAADAESTGTEDVFEDSVEQLYRAGCVLREKYKTESGFPVPDMRYGWFYFVAVYNFWAEHTRGLDYDEYDSGEDLVGVLDIRRLKEITIPLKTLLQETPRATPQTGS